MNLTNMILEKLGVFSALWLVLSLFFDGTRSNPIVTLTMILFLTWISVELEKLSYVMTAFLLFLKDMKSVEAGKHLAEYFNMYRFAPIFFGVSLWILRVWEIIETAVYFERRESYTDVTLLILIIISISVYLEFFIMNEKLKAKVEEAVVEKKRQVSALKNN